MIYWTSRKAGLKSPDSLSIAKGGKAKYMSTLSKQGHQVRMRNWKRKYEMRDDVKVI